MDCDPHEDDVPDQLADQERILPQKRLVEKCRWQSGKSNIIILLYKWIVTHLMSVVLNGQLLGLHEEPEQERILPQKRLLEKCRWQPGKSNIIILLYSCAKHNHTLAQMDCYQPEEFSIQ